FFAALPPCFCLTRTPGARQCRGLSSAAPSQAKGGCSMSGRILLVELSIDDTDEELIGQMRVMKGARQKNTHDHIICAIRGFDDERRELHQIPEVRAFCARLVRLAFISYLDLATTILADASDVVRKGWGAAEVWLCGEGRLNRRAEFTLELMAELEEV